MARDVFTLEDTEVTRRLGRLFLVSRIELALLITVVLVMTLKPWV